MMDTRNLLINAARAAEIEGKYYIAYGEREVNEGIDIGNGHLWNPLTRNEDAFSLMVNLYMDLDVRDSEIKVNNPDTGVSFTQTVNHGEDREKATRLAIVNCAAIIGENL
ncbi:hypothetical protein SP069_00130 [Salmonella phage SP069]|uniref:Uncharacterized protein n=2 Tax=Nonanavirus TaxID=1921122 RepID=S4TVZ0_9CAUD|nr:hypothetical protein QII00_sAgp26 [Salmonella phage SP069]AGF89315.1 hypothetical protein SP062_00175 [Salmonella phage FSL SP-062]AGF89525.1 hypothetical protein SP069_00130 [Salmonella phage SP069]ECL8515630.1 hypothetical protein [Salmonella enterica]